MTRFSRSGPQGSRDHQPRTLRFDVWWANHPRGMKHPVVLLSGDVGLNHRSQLTVAEVSTYVRGHEAEVVVDREAGLPERSAINLHALATIPRSQLETPITTLGPSTIREVERTLHVALGFELPCRVS